MGRDLAILEEREEHEEKCERIHIGNVTERGKTVLLSVVLLQGWGIKQLMDFETEMKVLVLGIGKT